MQALFYKGMNWLDLGRLGFSVKHPTAAQAASPALPRPRLAPALRPPDAAQLWRRVDACLCFSRATRRPWPRRLPAVGAASLMLTVYAWAAGIEPVDARWALGLGLAAAILGLHTDSND